MKKILILTAVMAAMMFLPSKGVMAQDDADDVHTLTIVIPEVALLDIESAGSKNITMTFIAPTEAGDSIKVPASNTSLWLNYSSIVKGTVASPTNRKVSVKIDNVIEGLTLKVTAGSATSTGGGTKGTSAGAVTLATAATDYDLITGVGSCWTESGSSKGHQLTYTLTTIGDSDYAKLRETNTPLTVTYTLTQP